MNQKPQSILPEALLDYATQQKVDAINNLADGVERLKAAGETQEAENTRGGLVDQYAQLNATDLNNIAVSIKTLMDALASGKLTPEQTAQVQAQLTALLNVIRAADQYLGVGNDISAGIASGMEAYGWSGDATTLATSIDTAIRAATGSHSPATKFVPVGVDIAAGVAKGVEDGTYKVENAMVRMAKAALKAAKAALVIESPSHVMRDEVGVMIPRGTVAGIEEETARQQQAVQNAFRSLVQPALSGAQSGITNNTRTVNNSSALNVVKPTIIINDKSSARTLFEEFTGIQNGQIRALGGTP
jgi:hypothetical protein